MSKSKAIRIVDAKYIGWYNLLLTFDTSEVMVVNFFPYLGKWLFKQLKDLSLFRRFDLDPFTLTWLDGQIGIDPQELYDMGFQVELQKEQWKKMRISAVVNA